MMNVFNAVNLATGEIETPQWVSEILKNLSRFIPALQVVRSADKVLSLTGDSEPEAIKILECHADDFYGAWQASSSEVVEAIGLPVVQEFFKIFSKYYVFTWPVESQIAWEHIGPDDQIQVFRGESLSLAAQGVGTGMSWTSNLDAAKFYKARHLDGVLIQGFVKKKDVLMFFVEEEELIVAREKVQVQLVVHENL